MKEPAKRVDRRGYTRNEDLCVDCDSSALTRDGMIPSSVEDFPKLVLQAFCNFRLEPVH